MIRSEHSIVEYDFGAKTVTPDRLTRQRDHAYIAAIDACLNEYRSGIGRTRQSLHRRVDKHLSATPGCPPRRISAFCKLLDDQSDFTVDAGSIVSMRKKIVQFGASRHPLVWTREGIFEHDLETARREFAESIGKTWEQIESMMFADVIELHPLRAFDPVVSAIELLSAYNLSQTQAALYRATEVRVDAWSDFKTIIRHAKLARLMHRIEPLDATADAPPGYRFQFDGPGSTIRETTRYGIGFAKLLGKLVTCQRWRMVARVLGPRQQPMRLIVSPRDGLRSTLVPDDSYDSQLEEDVDEQWRSSPVDGWAMDRESELLHIGQTVFTPDFVLRHRSGKVIHIEVVGYWTKEYLDEKVRRMQQFVSEFPQHRWLLMFPKDLKKASETMAIELGVPAIIIDRKTPPLMWIEAVERAEHERHNR